MNDLIARLVNAIFRQEGMPVDYTNPGNLRFAPWFQNAAYPNGEQLKYHNGFWKPRTRAEGVAGAAHVVALHIAQGNSLRKLISIWAPASDGNATETYIQNVATWAEIQNIDIPLWNYILPDIVT
jgi:hypothetical protein